MLSLLLPQLIGLGGGSPENTSITSLVFGALPVAIIGAVTWLIMQNRDAVFTWVIDRFTVTAKFESGNEAYAWVQSWAAAQPEWSNFRRVQVASAGGRNDVFGWFQRFMKLETSRPYWCRPIDGAWMFCRFKGVHTLLTFHDPTNDGGYRPAVITIQLLTLDHKHLAVLLEEARRLHKDAREGLTVWTHPRALSGPDVEWENWCMMDRRSIQSLVLDDDIKAKSLEDVRDFLSEESKQWYKDNSLPYRRGYLFYGVPGSGKTSLIHCIANELDRDVCVVTLSAVDDTTLPKLLGSTPEKAVVIIEDIDVAIQNSKTAANESRSDKSERNNQPGRSQDGLTLSGLLNAIDGVTSQNGRILFVTTNKEAALDPALTRAGRLDVHIEFRNAKSQHAAQLFRRFYTVKSSSKPGTSLSSEEVSDLSQVFADAVPDGALAMAQIQNYLMSHKRDPHAACDGVHDWIAREQLKAKQRQMRSEVTDAPMEVVLCSPSEPSSPLSDAGSAPTLAPSPSADHKLLFETVRELTQAVSVLASVSSDISATAPCCSERALSEIGHGDTLQMTSGDNAAHLKLADQEGADLGLALRSL
ncbi:unnamed protein product [Peniophora sp. CBMAI 1063]|nr:unnamed protein product [Peniophora sp. CBMAI 1063]